ncbi:hypothetical protein TNCV_2640521 [Trichonephila clavipes]|nr:hypothetical protein TNCV_2640521 [Trichonephila clavipes]
MCVECDKTLSTVANLYRHAKLIHNKSFKEYLCKEQLPAPGNRSNERRYREKDLATTKEKKVGTGEKREGGEEKPGS